MNFTSRTVRCNDPHLSQEDTLSSLYENYGDGIKLTSMRRREDAWIVKFDQPKTADFPPKDEPAEAPGPAFEDEGPPEDKESPDAPADTPFPDEDKPEKGEKKEEHSIAELLGLVHQIADALGISSPDDQLAPEGDLPGPPPPGPDAAPEAAKPPSKLGPGEVLPTQTPIGSPAFSSNQAATQTVESERVDPREYSASNAEADLLASFPGYNVKQLQFDKSASVYRALLSTH